MKRHGPAAVNQLQKTQSMVETAMFAVIVIVLAFTPFLGYIPLGFTRATTIHIPVILASILLGPKRGGAIGAVFGLTSLINNTVSPTPTSFVFSPFYSVGDVSGNFLSLVICFVPRILIGVVPYFVYKWLLCAAPKKEALCLGAAGVAGSLTNTLLVMNLIYLFLFAAICRRKQNHHSGVIRLYPFGYRHKRFARGHSRRDYHCGSWENTAASKEKNEKIKRRLLLWF